MDAEVLKVEKFGTFNCGLRNIRCQIDGRSAVFHLIPERLSPPDPTDPAIARESDPTIRRMLVGASLVVEGDTALRLEFSHLMGIAVDTDIDVDLFGGLHHNSRDAPRLANKATYIPLLEIRKSAWKAQLPEWRRRDDPDIQHFRMISAECSFDVLGELSSGVWVDNTPA